MKKNAPSRRTDPQSTTKSKIVDAPDTGNPAGSGSESAPPFSDRTYRIADLAVKIMALVPRKDNSFGMPRARLDQTRWDHEFDAAIGRTEMMLEQIEKGSGEIEAYQLFDEGELLPCEEIADTFKNAKWKGLVSVEPVRKLMVRLESQLTQYENDLSRQMPSENAEIAEDVRLSLEEIASRPGVRQVFPEFMRRLNIFIESLHQERVTPTKQEVLGEFMWFQAFSKWCLEKGINGGKPFTKYRAHEIFRFAAANNWESSNLKRSRNLLTGSFRPKIRSSNLTHFEFFEQRESAFSRPEPLSFQDTGPITADNSQEIMGDTGES